MEEDDDDATNDVANMVIGLKVVYISNIINRSVEVGNLWPNVNMVVDKVMVIVENYDFN